MTRYVTLLIAAYGLIAIETSLQTETGFVTPYGSFVWMLLPWLATLSSPSASIFTAALYGLMIDAVSNHHPGLLIAATIIAVCILQRMITPKSLKSAPRVFFVSTACGCLLAMLVATCSLLTASSPVNPSALLTSIVISTTLAAAFSTLVAATIRSCGTVLTLNQSQSQH
jgi:cell shape-determining protein MreD